MYGWASEAQRCGVLLVSMAMRSPTAAARMSS
jgi:hypothetical protein